MNELATREAGSLPPVSVQRGTAIEKAGEEKVPLLYCMYEAKVVVALLGRDAVT
jgi:hypothetical protein